MLAYAPSQYRTNLHREWASFSSITLPFLFCFYIFFWDCMVSESVCLDGWVVWIGVYSVYASTKSLHVNRTCSNSSNNQTSTRYFRNTVLWQLLCLVRACRVSSVASDSAAGCMCQRNNITPTVQSSPCFLPNSLYSVPFLPTLIFHPQQWPTLSMRTRLTHHLSTENNTQMARLTPQRG